ncbi:serrate RNA effector molecule-like isoform X2 [Impatiens glandulifera]|uniref:serrate RNA effector molecule-like isoform X2 n=1 Tax=Impatiens glandulifera TaxID=253017 RepID=UPI001FB0621D|nr:serrate RNA effector molecule-like isoform X2 [Impatiens glandulifera]
MAEVINLPADSLEARNDTADNNKKSSDVPESSLASPLKRRADRDIRGRRDDRELDRAPVRHGPGDYHDRNRSSPPPPDKDYKRRPSPSPPVPFRDRRHSPPRRSPPFPPFKRSRRDDAGYDRRGSPRGGYGPGDRRFGYDHSYDREMGGRLGYSDERHGRFGRPSDWELGRGYGDGSNTGTNQRDGLMTYKQFIQELEDDILPSDAEHRYQEYKSEYILTMKRAYFETHKDQEWLKDKYHPSNLVAVIERRNELARKTANDLLLDLQSGTLLLGPGVNNSSSGHTGVPNSDDEVDVGGKRRRQGSAPSKESDVVSGAPKAHPVSSDPRRIQIDIEQAQALVRKLDSEKVIEENILGRVDNGRSNREKSASGPVIIVRGLTSVKGLEGTELLDTLITYLWRVHGVDYYGLVESCEPPKGFRHVRLDGKSSDDAINGAEWEKKLDTYWQNRLKGQDPLEIRAAKEKLEAVAVEALDPHVRKIRDEKYGWKYGCGAKGCTKLFHAAEFVHKHLKLKHPELATEMTTKAREELYFQNYMNDADAPGGTPVMQERQQRRKLGLDQRLKDDRGNNRREWENREDRSDNKAQSMDFQSKNNNGIVGDSPDEMVFETYGAPSFPSDIPPPVLMPVPGAGPLGPFVPAPPGVAMRMLRDQGRPPFEGGGRSGPSPMIALPPSFHQDPRRIRSYQDLDAPEDEVTVIDYRSL